MAFCFDELGDWLFVALVVEVVLCALFSAWLTYTLSLRAFSCTTVSQLEHCKALSPKGCKGNA